MDGWPYSFCNCSSCFISISDPRIRLISAKDILEWAYNITFLLTNSEYENKGIPNNYYISCTNQVYVSDWLLPKDNKKYLKSALYKDDLKNSIICDISYHISGYIVSRDEFSKQIGYSITTLSFKDTLIFKETMLRQKYYSVIRAGLSHIRICDT